jgi:hypothetical protein
MRYSRAFQRMVMLLDIGIFERFGKFDYFYLMILSKSAELMVPSESATRL